MEWRVIEAKLFMERNVKTERKGSKELGKDLEKYTRTRNFGGLRSQAELRNMTQLVIVILHDTLTFSACNTDRKLTIGDANEDNISSIIRVLSLASIH
jgi:hypothetical protein